MYTLIYVEILIVSLGRQRFIKHQWTGGGEVY